MKSLITAIVATIAAFTLTGCGTLTAAKDKIHEWTKPAAPITAAPDVGSKGAGGGGRR